MNDIDWTDIHFIYLDMNGTFMFGHDRFGARQPYHETYRLCGGRALSPSQLPTIIEHIISHMGRLYDAPQFMHQFPSVHQVMDHIPQTRDLPNHEKDLICQTIARHECGMIDQAHLATLASLRRHAPLGVASNIWSEKTRTLDYFGEIGIHNWFAVKLFSSDGTHIKPSRKFFERAHLLAGLDAHRILFIGDDEHRDICPAKDFGFKTLKIGETSSSQADCVLGSLTDILPHSG